MGKGGGSGKSASDKELATFSKEIRGTSKPARDLFYSQLAEALQTGGVQARIPLAQQAIEQSKVSSSAAMRETEASLAATGLARTPLGQGILANQRTAAAMGAAAAGRVPIEALLAAAPNAALGAAQTATGGLAQSAGVEAQLAAAKRAAAAQETAGIASGVGAAVGLTAAAIIAA